MPGTRVPLLVNAANAIAKGQMDPDDRAVVGVWEVLIDADVERAHRADAALDVFHRRMGIEVLDDFSFVVIEPSTSRVLDRREDEHVDGTYEDRGELGDKRSNRPMEVRAFAVRGRGDGECDCGVVATAGTTLTDARNAAIDLLWDARLTSAGLTPVAEEVEATPASSSVARAAEGGIAAASRHRAERTAGG